MNIDPRITFWFGVWTSVLLLVASGTVNLTGALPDIWVPIITKWCGILGAINSTILTAGSGYSSDKIGPLVKGVISVPSSTLTVVKVLLVAFALSFLMAVPSAHAQGRLKSPQQVFDDIKNGINAQPNPLSVISAPKADPSAPLSCDFKMLVKLTPDNLVPTVKECLSDTNSLLVTDTQRALNSALAYKSGGDNDAVNCLTPALAIFQAGVQVPAVPAQDAVAATATTPAKAAVAAVPAQDPGPILLYQKYREFTLAGGLTACQAWFNGPVQATIAAGLPAAAGALGAAALIVPK